MQCKFKLGFFICAHAALSLRKWYGIAVATQKVVRRSQYQPYSLHHSCNCHYHSDVNVNVVCIYDIYVDFDTSSNAWMIYVGIALIIIGTALTLFATIIAMTAILTTRRKHTLR